jgi:hypothetical protein
MAKIFNKNYSKKELLERVGDINQICGVKTSTLNDGWERGVRIADVYTGSGFRYTVTLDRGMDISSAEFDGIPLAIRSPNGDVSPAFYDADGLEWLRTFKGGLVTTCGLTYLGSPCEDNGEKLGLHGRISNTPAKEISYGGYWKDDDYYVCIEGSLRECMQFKDNILLRRKITSKMGDSSILIQDIIRNEGYASSPLMLLYHCNIGFPIVDHNSKLITPAKKIVPRDKAAEAGLDNAKIFTDPVKNYEEQVFYHQMESDDVIAKLLNPNLDSGLGVYIKYSKKALPNFIEWKMMGQGTYVVGMEPGNCLVEGRDKERKRGTLQFLEPGEEKTISLEIGICRTI